jgi:dihydrolipoamide dehydrogenase
VALDGVPERLLVVGGGIIGLELGTVYDAMGSEVTVVELADQLIPGCDPDLVKPLHKRMAGRFAAIHLGTSVEGIEAHDDGMHVSYARRGARLRPGPRRGRAHARTARARPGRRGGRVASAGSWPSTSQLRTNVPHILAIGDVCRGPMLAHKASNEGISRPEVVAGHDVVYDVRAMPSSPTPIPRSPGPG